MKHLTLVIALFILMLLPWGRVEAAMTAQETAQLTANETQKPADDRSKKLKLYLLKYEKSFASPLMSETDTIVKTADKYQIDWRLIVAIAGVESTFCQFLPDNSYNCWGWGIPTGASSGIAFGSYSDGIDAVSKGLRERYYNRGYKNLSDIGKIYAASPVWAAKVRYFINDINTYVNVSPARMDLAL